jgi:hypothetical protein
MLAFLCRHAHFLTIGNSDATGNRAMTKNHSKGQRIGRTPKTGTELTISPRRVIVRRRRPFRSSGSMAAAPQWRCLSSCDGLDLLGYVLVAVFQRHLVHAIISHPDAQITDR